jgi:hypothetical protein
MGPVKFGDIPKTGADFLSDDFHTTGYQFKNKFKTNLDGAVVTTTTDVVEGKTATPSKMSWKFPKPYGIAGFAIDKFEMDKGGKYKFETSVNKDMHGVKDLKVEVKSDLASIDSTKLGFGYTGVADTTIQLDAATNDLANASLELSRSMGDITLGAKLSMATITAPDVGMRYASGPLFASLMATKKFGVFSGNCHYKVSDDIKVGGAYASDGKGGVGLGYQIQKDTSLKTKLMLDQTLHATLKHSLAKGFNVLGGCQYNIGDGKSSFGVQVSIE